MAKTAVRKADIKAIERNHCFKLTAACDDGSAFFIPLAKDGTALGPARLFTPKQIRVLAIIKAPKSLR